MNEKQFDPIKILQEFLEQDRPYSVIKSLFIDEILTLGNPTKCTDAWILIERFRADYLSHLGFALAMHLIEQNAKNQPRIIHISMDQDMGYVSARADGIKQSVQSTTIADAIGMLIEDDPNFFRIKIVMPDDKDSQATQT